MVEYITWEEFTNNSIAVASDSKYQVTNILCPKCNKPLYKYLGAVLSSYPAQYRYDCKNCGWSGTR